MESNTKQAHTCEANKPAPPGSHSENNTPDKQTTYWGVLCRTCRELVAFDSCPYLSFGPGAAGMKPGAIRCGGGHNHIYFPRDFGFVDVAVAVSHAIMQENREAYRAINPYAQTHPVRLVTTVAEPEMNRHNHVSRTALAPRSVPAVSPGTYHLAVKPYLTAGGEFKGKLEGVMFVAKSSTQTQQWFAVNGGQLEKDFGTLVSHELATEIVAALTRGDEIDFPNRFEQEQFDRGFHYEGSPVHFILCASTSGSRL
jgi:hypothetical protein